jgi:outer membrane protein assembly factor BamB
MKRMTQVIVGTLLPVLVNATEFAPNVVLNSDRDAVYATAPDGLLHRIEVATGQSRWISAEPAWALADTERGVLALAGRGADGSGELVLLDAARGAVRERIPLALPAGVGASLKAAPDQRFTLRAVASDDTIRLYWQSEFSTLRGALIDDEQGAAATRLRARDGAFELRLAARVTAIDTLDDATPPAPPAITPTAAQRVANAGSQQFLSADGAFRLSVIAQPDPKLGYVNRWTLYDAESTALGSHDLLLGYAPFTVANGKTLIYRAPPQGQRDAENRWVEAPLTVIAVDLETGDERWRFVLIDPEWRGAPPP